MAISECRYGNSPIVATRWFENVGFHFEHRNRRAGLAALPSRRCVQSGNVRTILSREFELKRAGRQKTYTIYYRGRERPARLAFEEQDLVKNRSEKKELEIPACTYEIVGALATLRTLNLAPGKVTTVPITDGKKVAQAKIEAQAKERVTVAGKDYSATRYEAFLFDNVLYRRRGRLMIWIGDGPEHLPLRFRLSLGFPIGTITVELQKEER